MGRGLRVLRSHRHRDRHCADRGGGPLCRVRLAPGAAGTVLDLGGHGVGDGRPGSGGPPRRKGPELSILAAALVGLLAGAVLYGATAAFMLAAVRWPPLRRQAEGIYELRGERSLAAALAVAALVVAPGEEIVWRGVVQPLVAGWVGAVGGAVLAWGLYVGVNLVARSIPILLGAVVGGAVWAALALWTGGVVAAIGCHVAWTSLMIVFPPVPGGSRVRGRMAEGGS
jgi:membrane protease YdiL (CAAX protease family)